MPRVIPKGEKRRNMRNYSYLSFPPEEMEGVERQFELAHRYRNKLCELELQRREAYYLALREIEPSLIPLEQAERDTERAYADAKEALSQHRRRTRRRDAPEELLAAARETKRARNAAQRALKAARDRVAKTPEFVLNPEQWLLVNDARAAGHLTGPVKTGKAFLNRLRALMNRPAPPEPERKRTRVVDPPRETMSIKGQLGLDHKNAGKVVRAEFSAAGLLWGTYNEVAESASSMGFGPPPRYVPRWQRRRYKLAAQLTTPATLEQLGVTTEQGQAYIRKVTPENAPPWLRPKAGVRRPSLKELWWVGIRVGSQPAPAKKGKKPKKGRKPQWASAVFRMSRALPEGSKIMRVRLLRDQIVPPELSRGRGGQHNGRAQAEGGGRPHRPTAYRWTAQLCCEVPLEASRITGTGTVGLNLGWRLRPHGLRIGMLTDGKQDRELFIDNDELARWRHADELDSFADLDFNDALASLWAWVSGRERAPQALIHHADNVAARAEREPREIRRERMREEVQVWREWITDFERRPLRFPQPLINVGRFHMWESHTRLALLLREWADHREPGDEAAFAAMEMWRRRCKHLTDWANQIRRKATNWRNNWQRHRVKDMAEEHERVVLLDVDYQSVQRRADSLAETPQQAAARDMMRVAAVGQLNRWIKERGLAIWVKPNGLTCLCSACGHEQERPAGLMFTCESCGFTLDQDANTARNALAAHLRGESYLTQTPKKKGRDRATDDDGDEDDDDTDQEVE